MNHLTIKHMFGLLPESKDHILLLNYIYTFQSEIYQQKHDYTLINMFINLVHKGFHYFSFRDLNLSNEESQLPIITI